MRVLILEDDNRQRESLVKIIEKNYIDVKSYEASTIKEAEKLIKTKEVDLLFVDINLPDGSGIEFAKYIRKIERYEFTGIIFVTTQIIQIIDAFKSTHCYDFIVKPYNEDDIKGIIDVFYRKLGNMGVDKGNYLIIPIESGISVKIYEDEIIFVEYANRKSIIHTARQEFRSKSLSLNNILKECKNGNIAQSHKSYLVNIKYLEKIEKVYSKLFNIHFTHTDNIAQLSNSYKDDIYKKWGM